MFGRAVRGVLPNLKVDSSQKMDEELRDRDKIAKFERNAKEDIKRNAKHTSIREGDKVLVMQQKKDKADTVYKNMFFRVTRLAAPGRATVKDLENGKEYERSVKHLKKYIERKENQKGSVDVEEEATGVKCQEDLVDDVSSNELETKQQRPIEGLCRTAVPELGFRRTREIRQQNRYKDYTM